MSSTPIEYSTEWYARIHDLFDNVLLVRPDKSTSVEKVDHRTDIKSRPPTGTKRYSKTAPFISFQGVKMFTTSTCECSWTTAACEAMLFVLRSYASYVADTA